MGGFTTPPSVSRLPYLTVPKPHRTSLSSPFRLPRVKPSDDSRRMQKSGVPHLEETARRSTWSCIRRFEGLTLLLMCLPLQSYWHRSHSQSIHHIYPTYLNILGGRLVSSLTGGETPETLEFSQLCNITFRLTYTRASDNPLGTEGKVTRISRPHYPSNS